MGLTKTAIFTDQDNHLAFIAKALAHPARLAILKHLIKQDSCICGDLVLEIGLAQPTISQHLSVLKQAGLIKGNISGTSVCYCIDTEAWQEANEAFAGLFASGMPTTNDCC
jgi:predicted transcriptional regulator